MPDSSETTLAGAASPALVEVLATLRSHNHVYTERELLKLADAPLQKLKAAPGDEKLAFVLEALAFVPKAGFQEQMAIKAVCGVLLRGGLPLNSLDAVKLVERVSYRRQMFPTKAVLTAVAASCRERSALTPALEQALRDLKPTIDEWIGGSEMRDLHERIDQLLAQPAQPGTGPAEADAAGAWSGQVFAEVATSGKRFEWHALFLHAKTLSQSTASRKWLAEALDHAKRVGLVEVNAAARRWLPLGPMPGVTGQQTPDAEADLQKGFIWTLAAMGDASIAPEIADFAFACFKKIPMIGAVSHRVGNACVYALGAMPGLDAVSQISRLAARVKYDVARRLIEKALVEAAESNGVSREDLEAMSVPGFGLDSASGTREETLGDVVARLAIDSESNGALLTWSRAGKVLKSAPASATSGEHAEVAAELKKAAKELDGALSSQRVRLERLLLSDSYCRFDRWREWYWLHPVMGYFTRRLIWEVESGGASHTVVPDGENLVDWTGSAWDFTADPEAKVRLWHPIRSDVQTVLSWRCWLEDHGVRQPFKQAHREVYLLTAAERETATFSNRFAGHIIKQHPFAALCRERGWQFNLMGAWDSHNTPTLELPKYKLRVELDVDFPHNEEEQSGHAIYLTIRTGQLRFLAHEPEKRGGRKAELRNLLAFAANMPKSIEAVQQFQQMMPQPQRLEDVPPVVLSEVMRDCDLFVGVTSIGADPAWNTDHPDGPHQAYWHEFAFGELTTAAENRKSVLESLLPKLAIRDKCSLDGRFLSVRGKLHEYRIHLGSGNVMIHPANRYLCIVPGPGDSAARLQLPFEGDRVLGIILSKAFLLVDDMLIRDESIRRQLQ